MHLAHYLGLLHRVADRASPTRSARSPRPTATSPTCSTTCARLARQCDRHAERAGAVRRALRRGRRRTSPSGSTPSSSRGTRTGGIGLLRDLHDLYLMASECDIAWTLIGQAAQGARDRELLEVVQGCEGETAIQLAWLRGRMKEAAPQALVVAR